jgi:hypothetical protein
MEIERDDDELGKDDSPIVHGMPGQADMP